MTISWEEVSNKDYLISALGNENKVTLTWVMSDHQISNMKTRKCVITSSSDWYEVCMSDSFVPRYKDSKSPDDPAAEIFTLAECYTNVRSDDKRKALELVNNLSSVLQITTAYDTRSNSRLIVDGFKRSLGILDMITNDQQFRPVTVLECYGSSVPQIFPSEFDHIGKK